MEPQLSILFHDDSVAVCVKPTSVDAQDGMPSLLREALGGEALCVHRLDRDVGGVMVYARSTAAAASLSRSITAGALDKTYLAVCAGRPTPEEGELHDLLYHDAARNKTYVVKRLRKGVREAVLRYRVLEAQGEASLIRILLLTGRTHQIRVQFAARGMPLLGDAKYGSRIKSCGIALWSAELAFPHPASGTVLRFSAPPPDAAPWNVFLKEGDTNA